MNATPPSSNSHRSVVTLLSQILAIAGAALVIVSLFFPWDKFDGHSQTGWELLHGGDIVITLIALAVIGLTIPTFFIDLPLLRVAALAWAALLAAVATNTLVGYSGGGKPAVG